MTTNKGSYRFGYKYGYMHGQGDQAIEKFENIKYGYKVLGLQDSTSAW